MAAAGPGGAVGHTRVPHESRPGRAQTPGAAGNRLQGRMPAVLRQGFWLFILKAMGEPKKNSF